MKIQEAFEKAREIFPEGEVVVSIEQTMRTSKLPKFSGGKLLTERWIHHNSLPNGCISSTRSWEHALAIAKSGDESCWEENQEEAVDA